MWRLDFRTALQAGNKYEVEKKSTCTQYMNSVVVFTILHPPSSRRISLIMFSENMYLLDIASANNGKQLICIYPQRCAKSQTSAWR